jgi:Outer membrane protein beta-barrel domain
MKRLRISILLVLIFTSLVSLQGQSDGFYLGAKVGYGIPNLSAGSVTTPLSQGYSSRNGFYGGLMAEMPLTGGLSLTAELNYSSQGGKRDGMQALPVPDNMAQMWQLLAGAGVSMGKYMYADINSEAILNYIEIPIMAKYSFKLESNLSLFVEAGPYLGILMEAKNVTSGYSYIYLDPNKNLSLDDALQLAGQSGLGSLNFNDSQKITSQLHRFNVGGQAAAGLAMKAGPGKIFVKGGGNFGFIPIQKSKADGTNNTGAGTVTIGYLMSL